MKLKKKMSKIILASKSKVRAEILKKNHIDFEVSPSSIDEDNVKNSLLSEGATPELISKNLAELKANSVSKKHQDKIVLGADSVIDLNGELISKPKSRDNALNILKKLNGKKHFLISSVCISKNGSMIWNYTDKSVLTMKLFTDKDLVDYLSKLSNDLIYAYNVYQIEGIGKTLFKDISGDKDSIMGLPIVKINNYLKEILC